MRRRARVFIGIIAALLPLSVLLPNLDTLAQEAPPASIWSGNIILDSAEVISEEDYNNDVCQRANMSIKLFTEEAEGDDISDDVLDNFGQEVGADTIDTCVVENQHGVFGTDRWSPNSDLRDALAVESNGSFVAAPTSNVVILNQVFGSDPSGSFRSSINYNMPIIGDLAEGRRGSGSSLRLYKKWVIRTSASQLAYANGSPMQIRRWAISANGRYAAAVLTTGTLVRINLKDKSLTPTASVSTAGRNWQLAVSNDGNHILSEDRLSSSLKLHDLSGCVASYSEGQLPQTGHSLVGCKDVSLDGFVSQLNSGGQQKLITALKFTQNSATVQFAVSWRNAEGVFIRNRIKIRPENYTSTARGYLAMGDSFSSGEGDTQGGTWYESGTDEQGNINTFAGRNLCHLSRRSYPYLLAKTLGYLDGVSTEPISPASDGLFHSVACSGARTHNIRGGSGEKHDDGNASDFEDTDNQYRYDPLFALGVFQAGATAQVNFLQDTKTPNDDDRPSQNPEIITIGIGGNDIGFGPKLAACASTGTCEFAADADKRTDVVIEMAGQKAALERTYKTVKAEAPDARIYVLGYPQIVDYPITACGTNVTLNEDEIRFVYEATKYYNDIIEAAAASAGVVYVNVENTLVDFNLCSGASQSDMAVNGATAGNDLSNRVTTALSVGICRIGRPGCIGNESFHPNQNGQQRYKETIEMVTSGLTTPNPEPVATPLPIPDEYFGTDARLFAEAYNDPATDVEGGQRLHAIITGFGNYRQANILLEGLLPNSEAETSAHSEPVSLGTFTVDANGRLEATIDIPADLPGGYHEIHIKGRDTTGNEVHYYEPVMLDMSPNDFDGDGVLNDTDNCPTIPNSGVDVDEDGIDDACDAEAMPAPEPEQPPQEPEPPAQPPKKESILKKIVKAVIKIVSLLKSIFKF